MIEKFTVSRDDSIYEAFPDVALTGTGRLVCVFEECTHHRDRSYTRIMYATSDDRGVTWEAKRPLTDPARSDPERTKPFWNCARVVALSDGRLATVADKVGGRREGAFGGIQSNWLFFSDDDAETWSGPHETPVTGIVPDRLIELQHGAHAGRWILSAHTILGTPEDPLWAERCWLSDDEGQTWSGPHTIAAMPGLKLCEGSVMEMPGGELICFLRENSALGLDAYKAISTDGGLTWSDPVPFPLPGCHRPVAGMLDSGKILITHRFMQGGKGWVGWWTQNFFAAITDTESCLAESREEAHTRILPLDFDRHPESDTGYSGWVQFEDGMIYVVNYILDDAPKAQIRGYTLNERDFLLDEACGAGDLAKIRA
jgi:sialidase-1